MSDAFSGVRVLDFTTTIAGPHCTRMLADLGAEVIKIEAPEGDMMRSRLPLRNGASTSFGQLNAGKQSVVLDLKSPKDVETARRLAATADVVVENFRPGVMKRLGLDYPALHKIKPTLIYCAISGYGQTGPSSDLPAYAPTIHAASGYDLAHMNYQRGRTRPDYCGVFIADVLAGTYAFGAIAAALHQRGVTGEGQMIDVSMLECMLTLTLTEIQAAQFQLPPPPSRPIFGPVETADGHIMLAVASERTFQGLAAAAGREDWLTDPRFAQYMDRRNNWGALMDEFEAWSKRLTLAECQKALDASGVPCSPYRTVKDVMKDPQLAHRNALAEIHDAGGTFKAMNPPFRMSASKTHAGERVAALGEHTDAVLGQLKRH
ncbi:MAG TPA: CaiB/BaiF CoA-transferase family protein [Candidatus Cybelea sp.]|nr:CaiB/BaiF CoA-transferase family protein [Candidatus Cybelea sp.]